MLSEQVTIYTQHIPFDIFPTKCNITQFIYFRKTALHVSGGISTHHQEHTTLFTVISYLLTVTATCLYCGRVEAGLSVAWELYRSAVATAPKQVGTIPTPHSGHLQLPHNRAR